MIDQRNLIIALVLSLLIVSGVDYFFVRPQVNQAMVEAKREQNLQAIETAKESNADLQKSTNLERGRAIALSQRIMIDSPRIRGSINLRGGRLDDVVLKDYHQTIDPLSPNIVLLSPSQSMESYYTDFGWISDDKSVALPGNDTLWQASGKVLAPNSPIILQWNNGAGLTFEKRFEIDPNYLVTVTQTVRNQTKNTINVYSYGLINRLGEGHEEGKQSLVHTGPLGMVNGEMEEVKYKELRKKESRTFNGKGGWYGITDKYWLVALIPDQADQIKSTFKYGPVDKKDRFQVDYVDSQKTLAANATVTTTTHLFAGAKEVGILDAYSKALNVPHLDLAINFGHLYFLTRPIFLLLDWVYSHVGNFGIAIIVLTLIIKGLLFPLAQTSFRSMNKMKQFTPQIQALKERYGSDKMKLHQEMMALYKREKIHPMSGCLPILIQIPVFFALYKVFSVTIEMRHAPLGLWIKDLSAPDPTNVFTLFGLIPWDPPAILHVGILPILMGITMYLQQKLNPKPLDAVQAQVFAIMPIVFTFILAPFPAGLVVYWTFSNMFSIIQQRMIAREPSNSKKAKS